MPVSMLMILHGFHSVVSTLFTELPEGGDGLLLAFHPETFEELSVCSIDVNKATVTFLS